MTTLQLQVEVDSEVHPELYALLVAVGRASLRPERLRQLAAGGLIWEHLRAQPRLDAGAGPALAEAARTANGSALIRTRAPAVAAVPTEPVAAPGPAPEEPPVLQDVVELAARPAPRSRTRAAQPPTAPPTVPVTSEAPAAGVPPEEGTAKKTTGPRSRLLLMKERGLFKNG